MNENEISPNKMIISTCINHILVRNHIKSVMTSGKQILKIRHKIIESAVDQSKNLMYYRVKLHFTRTMGLRTD